VTEINKDFYCSASGYSCGCCIYREESDYVVDCMGARCGNYHHKWPTPEQFKQEYGHEYPDDAAVWIVPKHSKTTEWVLEYHKDSKRLHGERVFTVCACTHWGKPPADRRPE